MKAAVLYERGGPLVVEEIDLDGPRGGEVLVRLAASGVCRSDLHMIRGVHPTPLPVILGHEGAGVVEEVGAGVTKVRPGDHVVLSWLPHCGRCRFCAAGRPVLCTDLAWSDAGLMRDGSTRLHRGGLRIHHSSSSTFAEKTVVPEASVIRIDPALPIAEAALLGCAVTTGVGAVMNTARVRAGSSVAVLGCGGVGLCIIQGAVIARASRIVAIDIHRGGLDRARDLGATDLIDAAGADAEAAVRKALPDGADYVFEALGERSTLELATRITGRGGTTVLVGLAHPDARIPFAPLAMTFEERTMTGCLYGSCVPERDVPMLVDLCRSGRLRLDRLVGSTCGLEEINDAFERMERGDGGRTLILYG